MLLKLMHSLQDEEEAGLKIGPKVANLGHLLEAILEEEVELLDNALLVQIVNIDNVNWN